MISRLTLLATTFAILGSASLAYAASTRQSVVAAPVTAATTAAKPVRIIQLQRVVVTARHSDDAGY